jgi:hypothetical protein
VRFAYADPPYPGCAHYYEGHPDFAGEVDHAALINRLVDEYPVPVTITARGRTVRVEALPAEDDDVGGDK